jgi:SAM-dependent methyltransferase
MTKDANQPLIADPSNAAQVEAWEGKDGKFWSTQATRFDIAIEKSYGPFLEAAAICAGDTVLDIGCGTGRSTCDVARIAADGSALGVDVSSPLLEIARQTAAAEHLDNVVFEHADAQIHPFTPAAVDVAISRMGSMFFGNPVAAFTNIQQALRSGGRLTLLTWQSIADNEWLSEFRTAMAVGRDLPTPPLDAPNPFTLSDPDRVRAILSAAGFEGITLQGLCEPMSFGQDPNDVYDFVIDFLGWLRDGLDDADRKRADEDLRATITDHTGAHGVSFQSATWIVEAHKP